MMEQTYDDTLKELAWRSFWHGYEQGYGVEKMKKIDKRAAKTNFERWWKRTFA